jgi:tetratricopeptide (TPR) repeat protein
MRALVVLVFCLFSATSFATESNSVVNFSSVTGFTGGATLRPAPKTSLLRDSSNNVIANACIHGASRSELSKLNLPDLDDRLQKLVAGNVLVLRGDNYFIAFPVITGDDRVRLAATVDSVASSLTPRVLPILDQIVQALPNRQEMVFHVLWSRVMDRFWYDGWGQAFHHGTPPTAEWRISPEHPYMVGTNSYDSGVGDASFSVTWGQRTSCNGRTVFGSQFELNRAAWGLPVSAARAEPLQQLGLFDADLKFQGFAYHRGDSLDKLFKKLSDQYADLVANAYDYKQLGQSYGITAGEMFLIVHHETAYAILEALVKAGKLEEPAVLRDSDDLHGCRSLISVQLNKPPRTKEDAMFLYKDSRGSQQTVEAFQTLVSENPEDLEARLYLGYALYDTKNYRGAFDAFQTLNGLAEAKRDKLGDWSRLWMGQMCDLLGERDQALQQYQMVLSSKESGKTMELSQYGMGSATAKDLAQQRISAPFTRK